jgi:hypothetical protein
MDIRLDQMFASVVRYIQNRANNDSKIYFDKQTKAYAVPSIYFPIPTTESKKETLQTYLTTIYMDSFFAASTDWLAYADAANVRDCILMDDCAIDIMEKDGKPTGKTIRLSSPSITPWEDGIVKLSVGIKNYFSKEIVGQNKANKFSFSGFIKPDALYEAWYMAIEELRKEEEAEKECLQKTLTKL